MVLCTFYDLNLFNMVAIFYFFIAVLFVRFCRLHRVGLRKCEPFLGYSGHF